jgi:hypothetical protein
VPAGTSNNQPQARVRRDIVDTDGKITLRHAGRLHHIGVGRTHARTPILMLINGLQIRIIHATTGQIIRELTGPRRFSTGRAGSTEGLRAQESRRTTSRLKKWTPPRSTRLLRSIFVGYFSPARRSDDECLNKVTAGL